MNYEMKKCLLDLQSALGSHYHADFAHKRVAIIEQEIAEILADNAKQGKDLAAQRVEAFRRLRRMLERLRECDKVMDDAALEMRNARYELERVADEVERLKLKVQIEESKSRACMDIIREMASAQVRPVLLCTNPAHIEKEMD